MEADFAKKVINRLSPYFNILDEQWSECRKCRIDYILVDKAYGLPFGIEFKDIDYKKGANIGDHIIQSMRYASSKFFVNGEYKNIPILLCPPISYNYLMCPVPESLSWGMSALEDKTNREFYHDRHKKDHEHHTVNGMLGSFMLGEIRNYSDYKDSKWLRFTFSNKILWDEKNSKYENGMHQNNYDNQIKKPITYRFI